MPIATRKLSVRVQDRDVALEIRIFEPVSENEAWSCRYEIDWPSGTKSARAVGVDAIQAIILALQKIGITLYMSDYHKNAQLTWPAAGGGYGFPVSRNVRDLLIGEDLNL
jgi:hypothetical protein